MTRAFILAAAVLMAAGAAHAQTLSTKVSVEDRDHCKAVGMTMTYKLNMEIDALTDAKAPAADIQDKKDVLRRVEDEFLPLFEAGQPEDVSLEAKMIDFSEDDLTNEMNYCVGLTM